MWKKIRVALAIVFFVAITGLFLDFTGSLHQWFGWMAKIQFLPALLAMNVGVVIGLLVLTLLIGRVYCSVICPLGVMQDFISHISGLRKSKRYRFSYSPEKRWLRFGVLVLFVAAMIAGVSAIVALLAPYSSYGRIVSSLLSPIYVWCNNQLAHVAERMDSYAFYETDVWFKSLTTIIVAAATLIVIGVLAWRNGRTYCNTICPVGTVLGYVSRFSLFRITIDTNKCNHCGLCSKKCKASCIDGKRHQIDYSRCVACMDCIDTCKHGAIDLRKYSHSEKPAVETTEIDESRRNFLGATAVLAGTVALKAQEKKVDGGLAMITDKKVPERKTYIVPPGAEGHRNLNAHCTACQLCISVCPNGVLRPSTSFDRFMQPESSYERGYCRPECTKCSEVCPTGAIKKITVADKTSIQIGHAVWLNSNCVPLTDNVECGNCARHCPVGAIQMVPFDSSNEASVKIPIVDTERCLGCGACENLCPSRPFSAIYVEGHERHRSI
jgi:ferredoxin